MREKEYFIKPLNVDIYAASIGVNSEDWYCFKNGMKLDDIRETMFNKNFDVVPILNKREVYESYYIIDKQEKNKLHSRKIEQKDRLYYLTHIRDVVWKMNKEKRTHYFLTNGHDEDDIIGLLSISNFNCREFYVYLFSLISYIEKELSEMIEVDHSNAFQILEEKSHSNESKHQLIFIRNKFEEDKKNNIENNYKEYLYIRHLMDLIIAEKKYIKLNYKKSIDFDSGTSILKELRNSVAHPVKSIVRNLEDLKKLEKGMNKLYELKERLDFYLLNSNKKLEIQIH